MRYILSLTKILSGPRNFLPQISWTHYFDSRKLKEATISKSLSCLFPGQHAASCVGSSALCFSFCLRRRKHLVGGNWKSTEVYSLKTCLKEVKFLFMNVTNWHSYKMVVMYHKNSIWSERKIRIRVFKHHIIKPIGFILQEIPSGPHPELFCAFCVTLLRAWLSTFSTYKWYIEYVNLDNCEKSAIKLHEDRGCIDLIQFLDFQCLVYAYHTAATWKIFVEWINEWKLIRVIRKSRFFSLNQMCDISWETWKKSQLWC